MVAEQLVVMCAVPSDRHQTSVEVPVLLVSRGRTSDTRVPTVAKIEIFLSQEHTIPKPHCYRPRHECPAADEFASRTTRTLQARPGLSIDLAIPAYALLSPMYLTTVERGHPRPMSVMALDTTMWPMIAVTTQICACSLHLQGPLRAEGYRY